MIYTVTFNPALDYVMNLKQLQYKDINRTESEQLYYGGKGINVSVILSRLKVDNIALGFLAGFSGKKIEEMLNAENIKNDFVYLKKGYTRINVKIKADEDYDINAQGPDIELDELNDLFDKFEKIKSGDIRQRNARSLRKRTLHTACRADNPPDGTARSGDSRPPDRGADRRPHLRDKRENKNGARDDRHGR